MVVADRACNMPITRLVGIVRAARGDGACEVFGDGRGRARGVHPLIDQIKERPTTLGLIRFETLREREREAQNRDLT